MYGTPAQTFPIIKIFWKLSQNIVKENCLLSALRKGSEAARHQQSTRVNLLIKANAGARDNTTAIL